MSAIHVTVGLLGLICLVNTAAILALIGRLRRHDELLWEVAERGVPAKALAAGARVAPFSVLDTDGRPVSDSGWTAPTLVAFLRPGCASCRRARSELGPVAAGWPGGRCAVLVVVAGPGAEAGYAARLAPVARVVPDRDEVVRRAFGVEAFPALFVVDPTGTLRWTGLHVDAVPDVAGSGRRP